MKFIYSSFQKETLSQLPYHFAGFKSYHSLKSFILEQSYDQTRLIEQWYMLHKKVVKGYLYYKNF